MVQIEAQFSQLIDKVVVQCFTSVFDQDQVRIASVSSQVYIRSGFYPVHNGMHLRIRCVPIEDNVLVIRTPMPRKCTLFWAMRRANATHICKPASFK